MAIREILVEPNPILRKNSIAILDLSSDIIELAEDLCDTLESTMYGVGLAVPQIGFNLRMIAWREKEEDDSQILINPMIEKKRGRQKMIESCLSVPETQEEIERSSIIWITGKTIRGGVLRRKFTGLMATIFQHEIDHLNGVLFTDKK